VPNTTPSEKKERSASRKNCCNLHKKFKNQKFKKIQKSLQKILILKFQTMKVHFHDRDLSNPVNVLTKFSRTMDYQSQRAKVGVLINIFVG